MITVRTELTCHGLRYQRAPSHLLREFRERSPRELYTSSVFREWYTKVLPTIQPTSFARDETPTLEVQSVLGRFAAGARLNVEPDEARSGDIKRLHPHEKSIWELKTGDIRIFGWFHAHDCFVAYSGDDATYTKVNGLYDQHVDAALTFLSQCGLKALAGDHHYVLTT